MHLWILHDDKPGHLNQSLGLLKALACYTPLTQTLLPLPKGRWIFSKISTLLAQTSHFPRPDLILAAGHRTHIPLIVLSQYYKVPHVLLMRPSLPRCWFDYCILPEHDIKNPREKNHPKNLISCGVLNGLEPKKQRKKNLSLILIGGNSKEFLCNETRLLGDINAVMAAFPHQKWHIANSRRTPEGFLEKCPSSAHLLHYQTTPSKELQKLLCIAHSVWVTRDSVSMLYEALSSGARVGVLQMEQKTRKQGRVSKGLQQLIETSRLSLFNPLAPRELPPLLSPLAEAKRAASWLLNKLAP